jgi:3-oxoacyl-[acyl-carrier protein] reductase
MTHETNADAPRKVALVTGASRGIGAACAVALGRAGFRVVVHWRSGEAQAHQVAAMIPGAITAQADLSDPASCQDLIKRITTELGRLDVLVNNAGIAIDQVLTFAKPDDFDKLIATNLKPVFLLSKLASKSMIRQKGGRIINMASVVGYSGNGGQSMYSATKAAITGFTKSIAIDLAGFGITANCVAPGFIKTDMTDSLPENAKEAIMAKIPLKRLGTPEDIAAAVTFLASDQAGYFTGSTIHVNGGMYTN